jgi:hypothetical protein
VVRLHLPEGFEYRSFTPTGTPMSDGVLTPGRHDGMAAFDAGPSRYRLVRNHEVNGPVGAFGDASKAYDPVTGGGTTTLELNRHATKVESWVSCNGTQMNCAGGATPWGSWLTCEETVNGPDVGNDFTGGDNSRLQRKHGYVFPLQWATPGAYVVEHVGEGGSGTLAAVLAQFLLQNAEANGISIQGHDHNDGHSHGETNGGNGRHPPLRPQPLERDDEGGSDAVEESHRVLFWPSVSTFSIPDSVI